MSGGSGSAVSPVEIGRPRLAEGASSGWVRRPIPEHTQEAGRVGADRGPRVCRRNGLPIRLHVSEGCAALGTGITMGFSPVIVRVQRERRDGLEGTSQTLGAPRERPARRRRFWLLAKHERGRLEVLAAELSGGERSLPVFSFAEEAELFLGLGAFSSTIGGDWRVRETEAGELASILLGPCRGVERVTLDPLPGIGAEPVNRLASLGRERFVRFLLRGVPGARPE